MLNLWRRLSKLKAFNEGERLTMENFSKPSFKNDMDKLTSMFQVRRYYVNNTPYQLQSDKYTNDMAHLQKELNFLQSNLIAKRIGAIAALLFTYCFFFNEEEARDWRNTFDLKFNIKAYGALDDSSGEGNISIDD